MAIILGRKQYLTQLLIFANTLKKSAEVDTLNDEMSEKQFNELNSIWNYAFASLIREGLVYSYIKFKDTTKDIIRLIIDSVQYDCPASVLRDIFKEDYDLYNTRRIDDSIIIEFADLCNEIRKVLGSYSF